MSAGIVEQFGHSEEALYNILPFALSKRDTAQSAIIDQTLTTSQTTKAIASSKNTAVPPMIPPT